MPSLICRNATLEWLEKKRITKYVLKAIAMSVDCIYISNVIDSYISCSKYFVRRTRENPTKSTTNTLSTTVLSRLYQTLNFSIESNICLKVTMKATNEKIQVLVRFQPILNVFMVFSSRKYEKPIQRFEHICQKFGVTLFLLAEWIFFISVSWFCIDHQFNLKVIAQPAAFLLRALQMQMVFIVIVSKSDRINMIINRLQVIVEQREFRHNFGKICVWPSLIRF